MLGMRCTLLLLSTFGSALPAGAQGWLERYEARATRYTSNQPRWAGPVITTVPMLVQVMRYDVHRQLSPAGATWNLSAQKGLQFVPFGRTELTVAVPPYLLRDGTGRNGWGDAAVAAKFRIAAAAETKGNYIVTGLVTATLPSGAGGVGQSDAIVTPSFIAGKGRGRFDVVASLGGTLPVTGADRLGRTLIANAAVQWHAYRYVWPELETNTTTWFGSSRDGETQSFLTPGVVFGRMPYTAHEVDRRRGWSVGVGYQVAVTSYHQYDHSLAMTTRFHF